MNDIVDNPKKYILWFIFLGLILFLLVYILFVDDASKNFVNGFSIFGTVFTLIGFIYTYIQLSNVRSMSLRLNEAVHFNNLSFNNIVTLSSVSVSLSKITSIQESLEHDLSVSLYKMKELKLIFLEINVQGNILNQQQSQEFQNYFEDFCVDIKNLDIHIRTKSSLTIEKISSNLEDMITLLKQTEVMLKSQIQKQL